METLSESLLLEPQSEPSPPPAPIVVTVPSSPDDGQNVRPHLLRTPPLRAFELPAPSDITPRPRALFDSDNLSPPLTFTSQSTDTSMSPFEEQLAAAGLPPPGAEHFDARRALWWAPGPHPPSPTEPNPSRGRLETLLAEPAALEDDRVWDAGLDRVWRGLTGGAKLKHRLPLALVIKILQAGWIREGTWPKGAVAPESDGDVPVPEAKATVSPLYTAAPSSMPEDRPTTEVEIVGKA
ncbi:hypothetical protein GSI_00668 [Ganoderma sinense ZZ0214-1]|uniref:DUF4050 domain-containing protein n=1 Tax=Ganoderma sinense ZZ0214-1 TaxID=1077348 RepID=A0A2G8ST77_9APHY|nr:hypothetical protein GSI_00668 [Ganoderma sinense ZZ0214-1]